jgi:hypothetical protein
MPRRSHSPGTSPDDDFTGHGGVAASRPKALAMVCVAGFQPAKGAAKMAATRAIAKLRLTLPPTTFSEK